MSIQTEGAGRTLAIIFTCCRCGANKIAPFDDVMDGEHCGYLHNSKLPNGWESLGYYHQIFCQDCVKAYETFMADGKEKPHG